MGARKLAFHTQDSQGWTDGTLLDVLLDYIDGQQDDAAFADYLAERTMVEV